MIRERFREEEEGERILWGRFRARRRERSARKRREVWREFRAVLPVALNLKRGVGSGYWR